MWNYQALQIIIIMSGGDAACIYIIYNICTLLHPVRDARFHGKDTPAVLITLPAFGATLFALQTG